MEARMVKWVVWQVGAPLLGPVIVSAVVVFFWWTLDDGFHFEWAPIWEDVTPWALTFYAITLIGATMDDFLPKWQEHKVLGWGMIAVGAASAIYSAMLVLARINLHTKPGTGVYVATFILVIISIGVCYRGAKVSQGVIG